MAACYIQCLHVRTLIDIVMKLKIQAILMWINVPTTNEKTKINNIFKLIQQYPLESAYPGLVDIFLKLFKFVTSSMNLIILSKIKLKGFCIAYIITDLDVFKK